MTYVYSNYEKIKDQNGEISYVPKDEDSQSKTQIHKNFLIEDDPVDFQDEKQNFQQKKYTEQNRTDPDRQPKFK